MTLFQEILTLKSVYHLDSPYNKTDPFCEINMCIVYGIPVLLQYSISALKYVQYLYSYIAFSFDLPW